MNAVPIADKEVQKERSLWTAGKVTALSVGVVALAAFPASAGIFGRLTCGQVAAIVGAAWLAYQIATIAWHTPGPHHPVYRAAELIDRLCRTWAVLALLAFSGAAEVLYLFLCVARAFTPRPRLEEDLKRNLVIETVAHLVMAAVCLALGRIAGGALVVLTLLAVILVQLLVGRSMIRTLRARVERDALEGDLLRQELTHIRQRLAREVHDGVGADVLALILQLRRAATQDPVAHACAEEAQHILEDLRSLVWSLRGEEGTVGELAKLIDARCARLCVGASYRRSLAEGDPTRRVDAAAAVVALNVASRLIQLAASRKGVRQVEVALRAHDDHGFLLQMRADGAEPISPDEPLLEQARREVLAARGIVSLSHEGEAVFARVQLPLEQVR